MEHKTVVITGGSTGIGQAIARRFAKKGVVIILIGRNTDALKWTADLLIKKKAVVSIIPADLSKVSDISKAITLVKRKCKSIDVLVNAAGVWHSETKAYSGIPFENYSRSEILSMFQVNLIAVTLLCQGLIPLMTKGSAIINISGTFESGAKGWVPYYVSKRGVEDLTLGLAEELKEKGIAVNCISPSDTLTPAYRKFFPQYTDETQETDVVGRFAQKLINFKGTGNVWVIKKGNRPYKFFHC
jgi:NAD(P)-dependent dehydrogenase (short-subunit alcohol dehydrogenase family)